MIKRLKKKKSLVFPPKPQPPPPIPKYEHTDPRGRADERHLNASTRAAMNDATIRRSNERARREVLVAAAIAVALAVFVWFGVDIVHAFAGFGRPAAVVTTHGAAVHAVPRPAAVPTVDLVKLQAPCPTKARVEGSTVVWFCDDGSVFYTRLK